MTLKNLYVLMIETNKIIMESQNKKTLALKLLYESKLSIINFQEELFNITQNLDTSIDDEKELLFSITEDMNYIVGVISVNCIQLEKILEDLDNTLYDSNPDYLNKIDVVLKSIELFNVKNMIRGK